MDEQTAQPDEQQAKPVIFEMHEYIDSTGRRLTVRVNVTAEVGLGDPPVTYIGHVMGKIPINPKQVAQVAHDFEIEAESVEHAFERFDEVAGATWAVHREAAIAEMQAQAQAQQQPRIITPGMNVPVHMGRVDREGGPH